MAKEAKKNPDNQDEEDNLAQHKLRMRFGWDDLIEEMIQDGQDRGAFDNLSGKGKPLNLERSAFGSEWDMAHSLMKENKVLPPWAEKRNRIMAEIELLNQEISRYWLRYHQAYLLAQGKTHQDALSLDWDSLCADWERKISAINKQIDDFNLGRPTENLEIFRQRLDDVLFRAGARQNLAG